MSGILIAQPGRSPKVELREAASDIFVGVGPMAQDRALSSQLFRVGEGPPLYSPPLGG